MDQTDQKLTRLLNDESFVRWINGKAGPEEQNKWRVWEQRDPSHQILKKQARLLYQIPMGNAERVDAETELERLNERIGSKTFIHPVPRSSSDHKGYWWSAAAVIVLLLAVVTVMTMNYKQPPKKLPAKIPFKTLSVGFGKTASLKISDGSLIRLNSNSSLRYKPSQFNTHKVDVWLKGEGYFSITHSPSGKDRTFVVHTKDGNIIDLGTKFNVNTRFESTDIVLEKGKVKLALLDSLHHVKKQVFMKPGERAILDFSQDTIPHQNVDTSLYTAWLNGKLKFKETSLRDIIRKIKSTYGVTIDVADSSLLDKRISGSVRNPDLKTLLVGLKKALQLDIKQQSANKFLITKRVPSGNQ